MPGEHHGLTKVLRTTKNKGRGGRALQAAIMLYLIIAATRVMAGEVHHAVVLLYHHVDTGTPASTSITPAQFDAHLDHLAGNGYTIWPLQRIVDHIHDNRPLPDRTVAITVDDAYTSVASETWPRLRRRGWPLTVFVNTDAADAGRRAYLDWEQMRALKAEGVVFANHSASHAHLLRRLEGEDDAAWRARVSADISRAQQRLEQELGEAPRLFAYPYGEYDPKLKALVAGMGFVAFGQQSGAIWTGSDPQAMPRFAMAGPYAGMPSFALKLKSLPLPVVEAWPDNPVLDVSEWSPTLRLRIGKARFSPERLTCYANGEPTEKPVWIDPAGGLVEIRPAKPLVTGRNRYNCTARHDSQDRYFWYSHPWIRRHADGSWYRE